MSLKDVYQRFLMNPQSASLASDISLTYITTTTRFDGPDAVVKHLSHQQKIVKTKSQEIISAIGGSDSLCADVETTLEFVSGGGAYLPSLDDNFLADRLVTFPMVHIVRFNDQQQIQQIRLYWDQGSLLKEVEVIGSRGRNWPIRDAKDQTRLIKSAYATVGAGAPPGNASAPATTAAPPTRDTTRPVSPTKKHIKDPHAAESLFELLSPGRDRAEPVRAPRAPASVKPAARDYNELFVSGDGDAPDATPSKARAGSNKNYGPSRLFDLEEKSAGVEKSVKVNPNKYSHFELGDEPDAAQKDRSQKMPARPQSRHQSQWDFEDFATPEKPKRESRMHEVRHFGWSDDEPEQTEAPVKAAPRQLKPRRDAETHFALADEDQQDHGPAEKGKRVISSFQNKGQGLYENNLYNEDAEPSPIKPPATNKNAGVSHDHRRKDFDSHWTMTDVSPANDKAAAAGKHMAADRQKHVQMMESSWDTYDESPNANKVVRPSRLRNANQPSWGFGDEQE